MLDGRVKTLHPAIHGGLLARRDVPGAHAGAQQPRHRDDRPLVVNLYPFEATVARPGCTLDDAIENIDIGGPAMVRSGEELARRRRAHRRGAQYEGVLAELQRDGRVERADAVRARRRGLQPHRNYDAAISDYLSSLQPDGTRAEFPAQSNGRFVKVQDLRYGENPHQAAAFYRDLHPAPGRSSPRASCRARSCPTTTSPTPTRPGSA